MGYIKAGDILPQTLIDQIQAYVDGQAVYIPRKASNRRAWGADTGSRELLRARNSDIARDYARGLSVEELAQRYYLSPKSIQKILSRFRGDRP